MNKSCQEGAAVVGRELEKMSWQVTGNVEKIARARELERMSGQVEGQVAEPARAIGRPKRGIKKPIRHRD